jgi:hypothetical protein
MPLCSRSLVAAGALALGMVAVGCSHEHGPVADKPDTTSFGNAGRFAPSMISTSIGLAWAPAEGERFPVLQGENSPLTTQVQPPLTLFGTRENWSFGFSCGPEKGRAMSTWTSGPTLPVEPWNMALEAPAEGEGHGGPLPHKG